MISVISGNLNLALGQNCVFGKYNTESESFWSCLSTIQDWNVIFQPEKISSSRSANLHQHITVKNIPIISTNIRDPSIISQVGQYPISEFRNLVTSKSPVRSARIILPTHTNSEMNIHQHFVILNLVTQGRIGSVSLRT